MQVGTRRRRLLDQRQRLVPRGPRLAWISRPKPRIAQMIVYGRIPAVLELHGPFEPQPRPFEVAELVIGPARLSRYAAFNGSAATASLIIGNARSRCAPASTQV